MKTKTKIVIALAVVAAVSLRAAAQEPVPVPPPVPPPAETPPPSPPPPDAPAAPVEPTAFATPGDAVVVAQPEKRDRGAFVVGVKAGGYFATAFSKLQPSFLVDVEVGYLLPFLKRSFAVLLDLGYTQPTYSGKQTDQRLATPSDPTGSYEWGLTQRELILGLTLMYRATFIGSGRVVPFIGVGPRVWFLQTVTCGRKDSSGEGCDMAAATSIHESKEQSTKFGVSVPIGVDVALGPGRIFGEAQLLWAPIDHRITGESSVGSVTLEAGYRLLL